MSCCLATEPEHGNRQNSWLFFSVPSFQRFSDGPSADWWSLGVTAYNILAKNPTEGPRGPFKQDAQRVFSVLAQGFKRRLKRSEYLNYARWTEAGLDDVARDFIKQLLNYDQRARLGSPVSGRKKTGW